MTIELDTPEERSQRLQVEGFLAVHEPHASSWLDHALAALIDYRASNEDFAKQNVHHVDTTAAEGGVVVVWPEYVQPDGDRGHITFAINGHTAFVDETGWYIRPDSPGGTESEYALEVAFWDELRSVMDAIDRPLPDTQTQPDELPTAA